ncbi:MAG: hypothetical protein U9Q84_00490 [Thermodesulfobacteriota bacterium]|nr:hypothetical protein [Thermodesulfobacteriota bacterium]
MTEENQFEEGTKEEGNEEEAPKKDASIQDLQAQMEDLKKESDGRLKALRSERQERQDLKAKIDATTNLINQFKQERDQETPEEKTPKSVPVIFDEEGEPFVDPKALSATTADLQKQISQMQQALSNSEGKRNQETNAQAELNAVLSQKPEYKTGFKTLKEAYKNIDSALESMVLKQGVDPKNFTGIEDALDFLETSKSFMVDFSKKYPTLTPDMVVEAIMPTANGRVNKRRLTQALSKLETASSEDQGLSKTLKFLTKKPNNLASASNQRGSAGSTLDGIATMNIDDFVGMSDEQIEALENSLLNEEMQGLKG